VYSASSHFLSLTSYEQCFKAVVGYLNTSRFSSVFAGVCYMCVIVTGVIVSNKQLEETKPIW